jgi:hypothetical protein
MLGRSWLSNGGKSSEALLFLVIDAAIYICCIGSICCLGRCRGTDSLVKSRQRLIQHFLHFPSPFAS